MTNNNNNKLPTQKMKYFAIAALFTPGLFVSGKVEWSKTKGDITVNGYTEYSLFR